MSTQQLTGDAFVDPRLADGIRLAVPLPHETALRAVIWMRLFGKEKAVGAV